MDYLHYRLVMLNRTTLPANDILSFPKIFGGDVIKCAALPKNLGEGTIKKAGEGTIKKAGVTIKYYKKIGGYKMRGGGLPKNWGDSK